MQPFLAGSLNLNLKGPHSLNVTLSSGQFKLELKCSSQFKCNPFFVGNLNLNKKTLSQFTF